MADRESIESYVTSTLATVLNLDKTTLSPQTNLLDDLNAKSVTFFPLINSIEDEYDLEIQYQDFRRECRTIEDIVNLIIEETE